MCFWHVTTLSNVFSTETLQESQGECVDSLQTILIPTHRHAFFTKGQSTEA